MQKKIETALNVQLKEEIYSSYLYLAMAAYCEFNNLKGFANWFFVQAQEEMDHARGFYNFMNDRGGRIILQAIPEPPVEFDGVLQIFEESLKHEQAVTGKINKLFELAKEEKDYALESFLKWYIDEQVEEEDNTRQIIEKIKLVGDKGTELYLIDKELSTRTYVQASILVKQ